MTTRVNRAELRLRDLLTLAALDRARELAVSIVNAVRHAAAINDV
jgi:hypothetical protein